MVGRELVLRAVFPKRKVEDEGRVGESWIDEAQEMVEEVLQRRTKGLEMLSGAGLGCDASRAGAAQSADDSHWSASKRISTTCPARLAIMLIAEYSTRAQSNFTDTSGWFDHHVVSEKLLVLS